MEIGTPLSVDEIISYEDDLHELINLMPAVTVKKTERVRVPRYIHKVVQDNV